MPRTAFVPTQEHRRIVKSAAAYGMPQSQIAVMIGLRAEKTLRKHFRSELDRGGGEATMQVAQSLFRLATVGGNAAAAMFWLKCRGGWRKSLSSRQRNCRKSLSYERFSETSSMEGVHLRPSLPDPRGRSAVR